MTKKTFKSGDAKITAYLDAPDWQDMPTAALGEFSCKTVEDGQQVVEKSIQFIREHGKDQVIGPMSGDTWHSYRFITETDGSAPFLLEPTNRPHDVDIFTKVGFEKISGYFSARVPLDQTAKDVPTPTTDFTIEGWDGVNPEALFEQVFELSVEAFSKNAFYKPISKEDFLAMYMPIVPMIKKDLIFFARRPDGSLAGFLFGIPNYAEGPNAKTVILKTYASLEKGAGRHLARAFHTAALASGYEMAIHALIHDDNLSGLRSASEGAQIFRRYSLFGLKLNG